MTATTTSYKTPHATAGGVVFCGLLALVLWPVVTADPDARMRETWTRAHLVSLCGARSVGNFLDAWGTPVQVLGHDSRGRPYLVSAGSDTKTGTEDDIIEDCQR